MEGFLPRLLVPERLDFDVLVPARIACPRRGAKRDQAQPIVPEQLNSIERHLSSQHQLVKGKHKVQGSSLTLQVQ